LGSTSVTRRPYVSSWPFWNGVVRFADIVQHRRQSIEVEMVRGRHDTLPAHFMELRCNQKRRSHKKNRDNTAHNQNPLSFFLSPFSARSTSPLLS
jgi:hypothetical protein